jgi:hypothetical protein
LRRDQRGIGGGERLGPQEVLLHPTQPRAPERRHVEANERLEAGVGRFRDQHGTDADDDVGSSRSALTCMREVVGKAGAGMDLEDQLGQVEPRQPRVYRSTQRCQACRLLDFVERLDRQVGSIGCRDDRHRRVVRRALGRFAPSEIEARG